MANRIELTPKKAYYALFSAALISIILTLGVELISIAGIPGTVVQKVINLLSETLMILLPYWLLPRRWRFLVLIPVMVLPPMVISAVWYMRFWDDLPPLTTLFVASNFNSETVRSALALWKYYDIIPVFSALATILLYFIVFRKGAESYKAPVKFRLVIALMAITLYFVHLSYETLYLMKIERRKGGYAPLTEFPNHFKRHFQTGTWLNFADLRDNGFILALHHNICNAKFALDLRLDLTSGQIDAVQQYIENKQLDELLGDSLLQVNKRKNIILFVVESLNSSEITPEVAPTLSTLIESQGTVSALKIFPQITVGCSGDGQLLANTGLLPLRSISTAFSVGSVNTFPALPRLLNRNEPTVIFGDDGSPWNEANTFANYGFENIIVNSDYSELYHAYGADRAMVLVADSLLPHLKQPFLLEFVTASMHAPFHDENVPDSHINSAITASNKAEQAYKRMLNYFDGSVSLLIESLRAHNLLGNTIIMLVSDHTTNAFHQPGIPTPTMTFIATNTGITEKIEREALQSDVFPTILQLCGAFNNGIWTGVGNSLFAPAQTADEQNSAHEISELILRGNYFKDKFTKKTL